MSDLTCQNGRAGEFPCNNVDLLSLLPLSQIGGGEGNDIWGWTDPQTGREYALMGRTNGTAFVDVTNPTDPVYLGNLPSHNNTESIWRDIKVYRNHAFIVADMPSNHGVQVFDLTQLRDVAAPPVTFGETAHYDGIGNAHNIAINEETGYAYAVGGARTVREACYGGLHMIDIRNPTQPTFAGCFEEDGYTHDAQCVVYRGPDVEHEGAEVCFAANEDTLTIVDVQDKRSPAMLARRPYAGARYVHQNWLTEDHKYLLMNDERDEAENGHRTHTYIWDVSDLDFPVLIGTYTGPTTSIDHNLYTHEGFVYEANYRSGLRILDLAEVAQGDLTEVANFDLYPEYDEDEETSYNGAWSVYPFFDSGTIIVSGIEQGLLTLKANLPGEASPTPTGTSSPTVTITPTRTVTGTVSPAATSTATPTRTSTPVGTPGESLLYLPILYR
jgi:choice-of-anchor B domain-containing protein